MPQNKRESKSSYSQKAHKLRTLGFNLGFKANRNATSNRYYKAAVGKAWNRARFYVINAEENRIEFKRFRSAKGKRVWKGALSNEQIMPGGAFIQRPKGVEKGKYKIKVERDGSIEITTSDRRRIRDVILRLDMREIAKDSRRELERVLSARKRPSQILLTVNGFDAETQSFADLESFNRYLEEELIPELHDARFNFKKYGKKVFGLKLVYSGKGRRKAKGEGKIFDFEKGGIFDESDKRVYGRKRYRNRKNYVRKKGKREGT